MLNDNKNKIKNRNAHLNNIDSNFIKVNSIMNQRLFGLLDYLKASIYFSYYNDENNKKCGRNLENFFKSKIFKTNPFSSPTLKNSINTNLSEEKNKNTPLDIIINIKSNKFIFQKNKYITPYDLHSKKHKFLKNMVDFSKHIHSESKMEKDFKEKYPKVESFPIYNKNYKNFKNFFPMTPKISRRKKLLIKTDGFTSTYEDKKSLIQNNKIKIKNINKDKKSRTYLSFDNKMDIHKYRNNFENIKKAFKNNNIFSKTNNDKKKNNIKNKNMKLFKANCYYNNLRLKKISRNLEKYTYLNENINK